MADPGQTIEGVATRLSLSAVGDGQTAIGSLGDTPVTMTILSAEPLSLLFALNINQESSDVEINTDFVADLPAESRNVSIDKGRAWLSLYEITNRSDEEIAGFVTQFHDQLTEAGLAVGPGCLRCGSLDDAQVMFVEGRTTRVCAACLERAVAEKHEREAQLNKMSVSAFLGLPAAILICAACWALFWFAIDLLLDWLRIDVIEINQLTALFLMGVLAVIGAAVGLPLGKTLRKSGVVRIAPVLLSCVVVIGAIVLGEIGYLTIVIFRAVGIVDFGIAAQLLGRFVLDYSGFWILCKLGCAGAIAAFCVGEVLDRKSERLEL